MRWNQEILLTHLSINKVMNKLVRVANNYLKHIILHDQFQLFLNSTLVPSN